MDNRVIHTIQPVYDARSRVLILGTMPSPKSREAGFYYMHPQNRFWRVLSDVLEQPAPAAPEEKRAFLLQKRIALWDVLESCAIDGADDGSIRAPVAHDLRPLLHGTQIHTIFTTGTKAAALYRRFCLPQTGLSAVSLPSTSPANCRFYDYARLRQAYLAVARALDHE